MSVTPRASVFWANDTMPGTRHDYFDDADADGEYGEEDEDLEQQLLGEELVHDGRTPLDRTIDRIGMGSYQWTLLSLCGLGWMADNMWIQAIAIILPRVQQHYAVPDSYIGVVSSSMFGGMMVGAVGWGTCSDLMGRSTAFNATLFFTSVFGLLATFANSFTTLCVLLFFLGSAVGGSMPTDGTLLLEHMPKSKQYLVTALSVFFSFGAVLSAVVALLVLPQNSCSPGQDACDVNTQNQGWKYLLTTLGLITLSMFIARMVFFRLHESPRYLVHAGRPADAVRSLQLISRFNGSNLSLELEDVRDHHLPSELPDPTKIVDTLSPVTSTDSNGRQRATSRTIFDATMVDGEPGAMSRAGSSESGKGRGPLVTTYGLTTETPALDPQATAESKQTPVSPVDPEPTIPPAGQRTRSASGRRLVRGRRDSVMSRRSTASVYEKKLCWSLPRWLRNPLWAWLDRVHMVLAPEWIRTTLLVWAVWCTMSLAYTMFNVFLPKLLETASPHALEATPKTLEQSLWDVVIFTVGGCPGAIAMWAVLYGWTPEIFGTKIRGTACGIASALSRIGGMIAPILGGILLMIDRSVPVYTSVVIFAIAGFCVLLLQEKPRQAGKERIIAH
ncbi:membrane transporter [Coprinellus micaceus]|uniref:Membrane transporter n=1 Tax=Coprinellus micaceus TaxID=71717 RepID=A0A4Y7SM48_COPMI|nr:membrane transporter [Coprinellus micaceus]